ncbi:LysR family transcriptional regulator [Pusillimonas sp.]|uniref:LysR family transcriptional regulator n=1 Tax=Pusillimonas sp. TaxID=3040095 RepID=UPI0029B28EAC|nr:LysR family transcriptional regulator [Pusillimonas sp.]MDX3895568.1 LysR family transcriptional regulator [Pusillimonas sp.]
MEKMDLNLLLEFEALFDTRSVTKASERLGISQPSMSHALGKMREAFNDPLFVRVKNEMQPTPRALSISGPIHQALELARNQIFRSQEFVPQRADRTFILCMTDLGAASYLPQIVNVISKQAPDVQIRTISPTIEKQTEGLETGSTDLAIGYFPDITTAGVFQQHLLSNTGFMCIANTRNPYIEGGACTMEGFLSAPHVSVRTEGRSQEVIEQAMSRLRISRRIMLTVPHYLSLLTLASNTDLLAIIPNDLVPAFEAQKNIKVYPLPFPSPRVEIKQIWHQKFHFDAASQWIREMVRQALQR